MNRGAWWATVHGIAKESDTTVQLSTQEMPRTWQSTHVALQRMGSQIVVASTYHFWWQDLEWVAVCLCVSSLQNEMEVTPVLTSWWCLDLNEITCVIGFTYIQSFPSVVCGIPPPFCLSKSDSLLKSLAGQATLVWSHFLPPQWLQVKCVTKSHSIGEAPRLRTTTEALHR